MSSVKTACWFSSTKLFVRFLQTLSSLKDLAVPCHLLPSTSTPCPLWNWGHQLYTVAFLYIERLIFGRLCPWSNAEHCLPSKVPGCRGIQVPICTTSWLFHYSVEWSDPDQSFICSRQQCACLPVLSSALRLSIQMLTLWAKQLLPELLPGPLWTWTYDTWLRPPLLLSSGLLAYQKVSKATAVFFSHLNQSCCCSPSFALVLTFVWAVPLC